MNQFGIFFLIPGFLSAYFKYKYPLVIIGIINNLFATMGKNNGTKTDKKKKPSSELQEPPKIAKKAPRRPIAMKTPSGTSDETETTSSLEEKRCTKMLKKIFKNKSNKYSPADLARFAKYITNFKPKALECVGVRKGFLLKKGG